MRTVTLRTALPAVFVVATLPLTGCTPGRTTPDAVTPAATAPTAATVSADELLAPLSLDGLDARGVIDALEAMPVAERPANLIASVRATELQLQDDTGRTASMPLPDDAFYVSIAPFVTQTHDCFFHSLTTCRGELDGAGLTVSITDADGTVVLDQTVTTNDNGFVGLWLPRGLDGTITITHDAGTVTAPLRTTDDAATCVTTLQLT